MKRNQFVKLAYIIKIIREVNRVYLIISELIFTR